MNLALAKNETGRALGEFFAVARGRLPGAGKVADMRQQAFEAYERAGLPHRRIEDWKYTDLRVLMRDAKPLAGAPDAAAKARARDAGAGLATIEGRRIVFVDGAFVPELSDLAALEPGLSFCSLAQALAGLNCRVIQSTSDEAPGRLAYGEHPLGAHHAPDVFHGPHARSKAISAPMAAQQRAAAQAAPKAAETRKRVQDPLDTAKGVRAQRSSGPGRPPKATPCREQAAQDVEAARHEPCEPDPVAHAGAISPGRAARAAATAAATRTASAEPRASCTRTAHAPASAARMVHPRIL